MFFQTIRKRLSNKVFSKILFFYSATILLTMFLLLTLLSRYYTEIVIQKEMDTSTRVLEGMESYLQQKEEYVQKVVQELYLKSDLIFYDIAFALQNDYDTYLSYRLDKYSESSSFVPYNLNTFFQVYFSQDEDIDAVRLKSDSLGTEYVYVNNHLRWNQYHKEKDEVIDTQVGIPENPDYFPYQRMERQQKERTYKNTIQLSHSINDPVTLKELGKLTVFYDTAGIQELVRLRSEQIKGTVHVLQRDGDFLYSSEEPKLPKPLKDLPFRTNFEKIKWEGKTYYLNTLADDQMYYLYVSLIPENDIQKVTIVQRYMVLVTIVLSCAAIAITYMVMRSYSRRINRIESAIHEVRDGNLQIRIPASREKDELSTISESFNEMLDDLNRYIKDVYVLNIEQREAEMKALQSQIQPHFLYNTLEAIRMKAIADGSKTTSNMIYSLGQLFRYSLSSKDVVQISDEMDHVRQYTALIQARYPNRLSISYDVPDECLDEKILKFTLQPLVENYMIHGFRKESNENELIITVQMSQQVIEVIIEDNGKGIASDQLASIQSRLREKAPISGHSIGLSNVHQRLQYKYGQAYGIQISSTEGKGTMVVVKIPSAYKGGA